MHKIYPKTQTYACMCMHVDTGMHTYPHALMRDCARPENTRYEREHAPMHTPYMQPDAPKQIAVVHFSQHPGMFHRRVSVAN